MMPATTITADFSLRDRVYVDSCRELVGIVTAVTWRHPQLINYEISWITNGNSESNIIEGWRLTPANDQ